MKTASRLVLVAALFLVGSASAQTAPATAPAPSAAVAAIAVTGALPTPAATPAEVPVLDFAKIVGASATGTATSPAEGLSNPAPLAMTCTFVICKEPCRNDCISRGCHTDCTSLSLCTCDCFCS
jgi:hypothetical protein